MSDPAHDAPGATCKLTRNVLGFDAFIELSPEEYSQIVTAKRRLVAALELEETFDLLLANYVEYERALFDSSLTTLLHHRWDWSAFREDRALLNRRIVNLLSSTRLYIDQSKRYARRVDGAPDGVDFVKGLFITEYDAHVEYRVMDALRNYVQHRGLPVGLISFPGEWVKDERGKRLLRHATAVGLDTPRVATDRSVTAQVRAELKSLGPVPLTSFLRKYVERLGNVHENLRKRLEPIVTTAAGVVDATVKRATDAFGRDVGIIVGKDLGERWEETHDIFEDIDARRRDLTVKNSLFTNLSLRYVSGEVPR